MNTIFLTIVIFTILAAIILMVTGIKNRRKQSEQIPYVYMGEKIFLTASELEKFKSSTREEKRRAMGNWKRMIKKGVIIPVYEKQGIVGYINNPDDFQLFSFSGGAIVTLN